MAEEEVYLSFPSVTYMLPTCWHVWHAQVQTVALGLQCQFLELNPKCERGVAPAEWD